MKNKNYYAAGLDKSIKKYAARKKANIRKEREEERRDRNHEENFWKTEQKFVTEKVRIYEETTAWVKKFLDSRHGKELFRILEDDEIIIYYGGWGHKSPDKGDGDCLSRIKLSKKGDLKYSASAKWMPCGPEFKLNQETIQNLSCSYLKKFYNHLRSGKVYKELEQELKDSIQPE